MQLGAGCVIFVPVAAVGSYGRGLESIVGWQSAANACDGQTSGDCRSPKLLVFVAKALCQLLRDRAA